MLQAHIKSMGDKNIKLVDVVQVMLVRRILPCQHRACNLWEFDPAKHQTLTELFGTTHEDIWKVLFKSGKSWPDSAEDRGYKLSRPASSISLYISVRRTPQPHISREMLNVFSNNSPRAGRRRQSGSIARPLEEQAGPLLTKMLVTAPYEAPKKKANKGAKETRGGLHRQGTWT